MLYHWTESDLKDDFYISQDPQSNNVDLKRLVHKLNDNLFEIVVSSKIQSKFNKFDLLMYLNESKYYPWED